MRRAVVSLGAAVLVAASFAELRLVASGLGSGLTPSLARPQSLGQGAAARSSDFGTLGSRQQAETDDVATWVHPVAVHLPDGSTETTYVFPDGSVMTSVTPPAGFDPLAADNDTLTRYGFPLPPSDASDFDAWYAAMSAFKSDDPPTEPLKVSLSAPTSHADFATLYTNWGGYIAGTLYEQSHRYVAVKGNLTIPSNTGTCSDADPYNTSVGFWIGLGGTGGNYPEDNLVQQGVECGNHWVGSGSSYRPFTQFANTQQHAVAFCGYSSWILNAGDVIYQNMSFQTSQNKAFFYLEDQTSGVAHSCSRTPPAGWHWNLNTAEWIGEASEGIAVNFGSLRFSNTRAQLYSNSNWVTLGSQTVTETIQGEKLGGQTYKCIDPGAISNGTAFTDYWISPGTCYAPF